MTRPVPRRARGLRIARVMGVPVVLNPSWFAFAVLVAYTSAQAVIPDHGTREGYEFGVAFTVLLLGSVVLHEIGHCIAARTLGLPVRSITITFIAGLTEITEPPETAAKEYAVAASGPMVSLLLAGVGFGLRPAFETQSLPWLVVEALGSTNLLLLVFNVLPGLPLDGGRVLRAALWGVFKDGVKATRGAARAGQVVAVLVAGLSVLGAQLSRDDRGSDAYLVVFGVLLGAYLYTAATVSLRQAGVQSRMPGVSVEALARPALAVVPTTPLAEAVRRAHEAGVRALVVVDGNGRLEGVVSEAWVRDVPVERRPWVVVADGARRLKEGLLLDPALAGEALLEAMRASPSSEYVVPGDPLRVLVSSDVATAMSGSPS